MASIFEEVTIVWGADEQGEPVEYKITPTYADVQAIENMGISILGVIGRIQRGELQAAKISDMVCYLLRKAGCEDVTPADVYEELVEADVDDFTYICNQITRAFIPSKKSSSRTSKFSRKKRKKRSKKKT